MKNKMFYRRYQDNYKIDDHYMKDNYLITNYYHVF